jgi:hypothetical protein
MIVFPAMAALVALACAVVVGWDALRRPKPERVIWTAAFAVFALAAGAEVVGGLAGWSATLTRVYYLSGAVLVVGFLALGELYLLLPERMPAVTPGLALLVTAIAVTAVWSAPVETSLLGTQGWEAIERGPLLIAVAVGINAGGTLVLIGGALYSAWRLRGAPHLRRRALGCIGIALGTMIVAAGGTLTRFGHREYLYIAMAVGVVVIFAGVLLTRGGSARRAAAIPGADIADIEQMSPRRARLIPLPQRQQATRGDDPGIAFVAGKLLALTAEEIGEACLAWSATAVDGDVLSRKQAKQVWALRLALPAELRERFDALPLPTQAQLAELRSEVWTDVPAEHGRRGA